MHSDWSQGAFWFNALTLYFYADICHVVDLCYQTIPYQLLQDYLGNVGQDIMADLIAKHEWTLRDKGGKSGEEGVVRDVFIKNQEVSITPQNVLTKIEFGSEFERECVC